ncbi:MAG: ABC transporter permease [Eubacterium sp.]
MKNKKSTVLGTVLFYAGVLIIWQIIYSLGTQVFEIWKSYSFPNIKSILIRFGELVSDGSIQLAIAYSVGRGIIGYLIACVLGCFLGMVILEYKTLGKYLKPLLMGIQTLPSICWVPFAILWFGLGNDAIIFVVVMGSALSIALSVESSIRNIDPLYLSVAGIMGAKGLKLVTKVIIPAALPSLISGFRQGWSFAWRALMSGEVISSSIGLGYTLMLGRNLADINQVMLVMIVIIIIGIIMDKVCFSLVENKVLAKRGLK